MSPSGWACSSRTCCCWLGWTRSARWNSDRVDLLALASDAVHDAQVGRPASAHHLEVFDGPGTPEVLGDEARLRQVLGNLVANALQHTPESASITIRVGTEQDNAMLEVSDEGPGMSCEDAHRVFERFYRTDSSRARASGGTGLGLSIVDSLVYAHGGTVSVTTAPGQGCRFIVKLPRIADVAAADVDVPTPRSAQPSSASAALILACASSSDSGDGLRSTLAKPKSDRLRAGKTWTCRCGHLESGDDQTGALGAEGL